MSARLDSCDEAGSQEKSALKLEQIVGWIHSLQAPISLLAASWGHLPKSAHIPLHMPSSFFSVSNGTLNPPYALNFSDFSLISDCVLVFECMELILIISSEKHSNPQWYVQYLPSQLKSGAQASVSSGNTFGFISVHADRYALFTWPVLNVIWEYWWNKMTYSKKYSILLATGVKLLRAKPIRRIK